MTKPLLCSQNWNLIVEVVYFHKQDQKHNKQAGITATEGGMNHAIIENSVKSIHLTLKLLREKK